MNKTSKLFKILLYLMVTIQLSYGENYICFTYMSANYKDKVPNDKWKKMYPVKVDITDKRMSFLYGDTYLLKEINKKGQKLYTHPAHDKVYIIYSNYDGVNVLQTFYRLTNTIIGRDCVLESTLDK